MENKKIREIQQQINKQARVRGERSKKVSIIPKPPPPGGGKLTYSLSF